MVGMHDMMAGEEYITETECARRLNMSVKTLRRKKGTVFLCGEHYFTPGWTSVRWKWSAVREKVEAGSVREKPGAGWRAIVGL